MKTKVESIELDNSPQKTENISGPSSHKGDKESPTSGKTNNKKTNSDNLSNNKQSSDGTKNRGGTPDRSNGTGSSDRAQKTVTSSDKLTNRPSDTADQMDNIIDDITSMGHCARLRHNTCFKTFVFLLVMALNGADLIADWLLFRDVYDTKEGLVYGPPEKPIIYALLAFSITGTLTFIFEVINLWWEIYRENPWINADLASAITIWIEDIPQIILNLLIALCREEAISYFQLVKASVIIAGVVIRIIVSLVRYCNKKSLAELHDHTEKSCRHVTYRFIIMIGLICIFSCSLAVFFLTQFERTDDGKIKFNLPKTIFVGRYDEERYFKNVSMYLHHPLIDFDAGNLDSSDVNWIRLISLYDVREKGTEVFKLEYDQTKTKIVIWQTNSAGSLSVNDCYTMDRTSKTVTRETSCQSFITGQKTAFVFKFEFVQKSIPNLIFGDVKYNVNVKENGVCHDPTSTIVTRLSERRDSMNILHPVIHYYRTNNVVEDHHLLWTSTANGARFYRNKGDLIDISTVWKTGYGSCDSTGSLAPHRNTDISVDCNV